MLEPYNPYLTSPQISLARAPGVAYTTFLCLLVVLGFAACAVVRASTDPAVAGCGQLLMFAGGVAIQQGQFAWPAHVLWHTARPNPNAYALFSGLLLESRFAGGVSILQGQLLRPEDLPLGCCATSISHKSRKISFWVHYLCGRSPVPAGRALDRISLPLPAT